jgi:hypothetical protein
MLDIDLFSLLQMPDKVIIEETSDPNNTRFILQPLEKGYGVTIGNSFRRVLISTVPGYAIIGVKFTDVLHEFQNIPGGARRCYRYYYEFEAGSNSSNRT